MRLTRFTDNALRCLMYLGARPGRTATVHEVASRMAMSEDHLTKVVQRLAQHGFVTTIRGRNGGVRLARSPEEIAIGEVVRATEEDCCLVPCFADAASCPISSECALAGVLDGALEAFFEVLNQRTLSQLLNGDGPVRMSRGGLDGAAAY